MRPKLKILAALSVLGFLAHAASAEDITISTYYPSPYGSYQELETTGQTTLAATSGNVGIRNSAPLTLLDIGSTTLPTDAMINVNAAANRQTGINFQSAGANSWAMYKPPSSTNLRFWDGTTDRVTFANGGNVGIGTTAPASMLDVAGEARIGSSGLVCDASTVGAMRYSGGAIQYCNGTAWTAMGGGGLQSVQVFDTPGTYTWTRPSGITKIKITVVGGGASSMTAPYGGGAGGACIKFLDVSATPSSVVTVGAGGASGISDPGGDSSFVGGCSATGGGSPGYFYSGVGSGGDLNMGGETGTDNGAAGSSMFGGGGAFNGKAYGSGGGYSHGGSSGVVIVEEY